MGRPDRIGEVERDRTALRRILALLLVLSGLAERASGLPVPHRCHVLRMLGCAEARARAFTTGAPYGASGTTGDLPLPQADYAARLAASLRTLALVFGALLARAEMRGQFTYFPDSRLRTRACHWEISKLSPYFLRRAARAPPIWRASYCPSHGGTGSCRAASGFSRAGVSVRLATRACSFAPPGAGRPPLAIAVDRA